MKIQTNFDPITKYENLCFKAFAETDPAKLKELEKQTKDLEKKTFEWIGQMLKGEI